MAELNEIEKRILQLGGEFPQGITHSVIQNDLPQLSTDQIVKILNRLIAISLVDLNKKNDGTLIFKLRDPGSLHKIKGAEAEEQVVYGIVAESGSHGIWLRDIRAKSNLHMNTVGKVLKKLEGQKLIKSFNPVATPKKKTYILYDLEPDRSLTGGAWYSEQNFDAEFVRVLSDLCWRYLEQKSVQARQITEGPIAVRNASFVSSKEVLKHINESKIAKVELSTCDLESLLETLVYDGKVETSSVVDGTENIKIYRSVMPFVATPALVQIPCGVCPLIMQCDDIGNVTPLKCIYMKEWMKW